MTEAEFAAAVASGPIVDNAGSLYVIGELEYDGPRCEGEDCRRPVSDGVQLCDDCKHDGCTRCDGDGCDWHLSPTNGAIEIDRACPTCEGTGRTPR